jgi:hypothetical protein
MYVHPRIVIVRPGAQPQHCPHGRHWERLVGARHCSACGLGDIQDWRWTGVEWTRSSLPDVGDWVRVLRADSSEDVCEVARTNYLGFVGYIVREGSVTDELVVAWSDGIEAVTGEEELAATVPPLEGGRNG